MNEQKPSIGRIVHYQAHGSPDGTHKSEPRAAVITAVENDTKLSLCVLNPSGFFFNQGVLFDGNETPKGGTWRWPPRVVVFLFAALGLGLMPLNAYADDIMQIATSQPKTVGELLISLLPHVLGLLSFALVTYVAPALKAWLTEKAKMNALARVALKVETLSESIVAYLNAGMKAQFEAAAADGRITAAEGKQLADEALRLTKEFLGKEGLLSIGGVLGLATGMVDVFLKGQLEKAVEKANVIAAAKPVVDAVAVGASGPAELAASPQ